MSRPRPPRDREAAPGDPPGAESFARAASGEAPQGIVRLSDLFSPDDFDAETGRAARAPSQRQRAVRSDGPSARRTGRGRASAARSSAGANDRAGDSDASGRVASSAHARPRAVRPDYPCEPRDAGSATDELASRRSGQGHRPTEAGAARRDAADAHNGAPSIDKEGPAYERLFGGEVDTRRRPKRERKPATALQRALGLLTRREHSRKELTRKLVARGVDAAEVEAAVDKLTGAGWQDDCRFAESLVRSRASAGYGPLHIRAELGTHDLPAEVRQAALDGFEGDWTELARDAVHRRFGRIGDDRVRERKAADWLLRRGFPSDIVRAVSRFPAED